MKMSSEVTVITRLELNIVQDELSMHENLKKILNYLLHIRIIKTMTKVDEIILRDEKES